MSRYSSIFGQILQLFPKTEFYQAVKETGAEKNAKGFTSWGQFVGMLFCQVGRAHSLREICGGLASSLGKLIHLGITEAPARSTLAYANEHRSWRLYEKIFYAMLKRCQAVAPRHKFSFKNKLYSMDATLMELCASIFGWAKYVQTKGAVKLHMLLDHDGYLPVFAHITEGCVHEVNIVRGMTFPRGSIVVMDRGYVDYALFFKWTVQDEVYFVMRLKSNAVYTVIESNTVPVGGKVVRDEMIMFSGYSSFGKCPVPLRRIEVLDDKGEIIVLLTNHFEFAGSTIAKIYRDRWQIETFFKTIKQNLRIKTFVGTSPNAVMTQIWTALIAILVLKYLKFRSTFGWSMSNLVAMLRYNLIVYRGLWEWLNNPYQELKEPVIWKQLELGIV